ncbi:MAG: glucose-6-phosphate isomerase [Pseudomonadales bacterium]|nr:glucose-6-phosphate isomerase [Pseudomonadales bacterium]
MKPTSECTAWTRLQERARTLMRDDSDALSLDSSRLDWMSGSLGRVWIDFSRQAVDDSTLARLVDLAREARLGQRIRSQFRGDHVNLSEDRAALHMACRGAWPEMPDAVRCQARASQERMLDVVEAVRDGKLRGSNGKPFRHVVNLGIGGSHLGPALVVDALGDQTLDVRFLVERNAHLVRQTLQSLDLAATLFVVNSKSFRTEETLENAKVCRQILQEHVGRNSVAQHFWAVTTNADAARTFGIAESKLLAMPDWVGGRFSVWSAFGITAAMALGTAGFKKFLEGGSLVDEHLLCTDLERNIPVLMALFALWNCSFLICATHAVRTYEPRLSMFVPFLQQLEMESNGKTALQSGGRTEVATGQIVWGGAETAGQHSFHQLLHQGSSAVSVDIVSVLNRPEVSREEQVWGLSQMLANASLLFHGHTDSSRPMFEQVAGGRSASLVLLEELDPTALGTLIALYEHKVACLGFLWGTNPFDQWGVEHGKTLAKRYRASLQEGVAPADVAPLDAATVRAIIQRASRR